MSKHILYRGKLISEKMTKDQLLDVIIELHNAYLKYFGLLISQNLDTGVINEIKVLKNLKNPTNPK